ncbi:MAG: hypothetical protein AAF215_02750 [Cyanobacteria bacterium P01_A01_bin.123]
MPQQIYDWKRFWCPRTGSINLADGGYLSNPEAEGAKAYNPDLVALEEILDGSCLVLLGEPGIGKSRELEKLRNYTEEVVDEDDQILSLDLEDCSENKLYANLFNSQTFIDWIDGTHRLYLFLDSLDQGWLTIQRLPTLLVEEFRQLDKVPEKENLKPSLLLFLALKTGFFGKGAKIKDRPNLSRLYLRLVCRVFPFSQAESDFKDLWSNHYSSYYLTPLSERDIRTAFNENGLDADQCWQEIIDKELLPFATKPISLQFLIKRLQRNNGQLPKNQNLVDIYIDGYKELCRELKDETRHPLKPVSSLDVDQRLSIAARIAAIMTFCLRPTIWAGQSFGDYALEIDVQPGELCGQCESTNTERGLKVTSNFIQEVLDTALFSDREVNRMGWAHQTYAGFLAAWYLTQHKVSIEQIKKLIFSSENTGYRLVPQLYETAAWLASMRHDVLQIITKTDPDVLLQSDLSGIDQTVKALLIDSLLKLHDSGKLVYQYDGFREFQHLTHPDILRQLELCISDSTKNIQARYVAIDIAESCNLQSASPSLVEIALSSEHPYAIRTRAANFVVKIGRESDKARLRDLYIIPQDDPEDDLKGYGLRATYPKDITTEEVLSHLTQPQVNYFGGCYQKFLAEDFGQRLPESDLNLALAWVRKQPVRHKSHYPFDALADSIMLRAWEKLDDPAILSVFAEVIVSKQSQYAKVIGNYDNISFKEMLQEDDIKRRALIEKCVSVIQDSDRDPYWLSGNSQYSSLTPLERDFAWLIEKLETSNSEQIQRVYAKLINWELDWKSAGQISLVITASQINSVLKAEFAPYLELIPLNSQRADELKLQYLERQRHLTLGEQQKLEPPPKTRILQCLDRLESGQVDAWWYLCQEMTLLPTSTHYNQTWKVDITTMPGWQEANETVRRRIIEAAKQYIYKGNSNTDSWLGTRSFPQYVLSGYQALRLVSFNEPEFISILPAEIWKKWTAIILDYPNAREDKSGEIREELLKGAYHNASDEFFRVLDILITQENSQRSSISIHREVECCWDETLKSFLLAKVQDETMTAGGLGDLLEMLLAHQVSEAISFAESLIVFPLPEIDKERSKVAVVAQKLILYSADTAWPNIWRIIQACPEFGKEVLEAISYALKYEGSLETQIKEEYTADLYIFLTKHYSDLDGENRDNPQEEELAGLEAYIVGPADSIRLWRDRIPQRLQELGTPEACQALQKIIGELPELKEELQWRLPQAEALTRRKAWQPPTPEELLQLVIIQEPSNSEVVDRITKKMEDEPKIKNEINISNSPNSPINAPVGTSGKTDSHVTISSSDEKRGINWGNWLAVIGILAGMLVSGAFNEEFREGLNRMFSPQVEKESTPQAD